MGLLFSTNENRKILESCRNILEDGTFKSSPAPFEQLEVLFGNGDRTVSLVFGLFSGKALLLSKNYFGNLQKRNENWAREAKSEKIKTDK